MSEVTRRRLLGATAAGGAAGGLALTGAVPGTPGAGRAAADPAGRDCVAPPAAVTVTPADPRYGYLSGRGLNRRFTVAPGAIHQVFTAGQVAEVLRRAVPAGQRIAVRSGGHCLDGLVDRPEVTAVIDVGRMNRVYYDAGHRAFAVESGALLGDVYQELLLGWGVTIPGGTCPTVGVGGFVTGGGFGSMCRRYGMCVDHLYGVEVVVCDASGHPRTVVATREAADPDRDLWWAHTGAGGGSFGVVTRFLFRSPGATGTDPAGLLPRPPARTLVANVSWAWSDLTPDAFTTLVRNHGAWHEAHAGDGGPYASLFSGLLLQERLTGQVRLVATMDGTRPDAAELLTAYIEALNAGAGVAFTSRLASEPWLRSALSDPYGEATGALTRTKGKGAYLRRSFSEEGAATLYRYLTSRSGPARDAAGMVLFSYGGRVNSVPPPATANPHRDSVLLSYLAGYWSGAEQDEARTGWVRDCYAELFAAGGGVPAPDADTDGSYINYPDLDLLDPGINTSGIPWHTLYFKENYPRLRVIKERYDPGDVFRHPLSVRLPG